MFKKSIFVISALMAFALILSACAPAAAPAAEEAAPAAEEAKPAAEEAAPAAEDELFLGYVIHVPNPFTEVIRRGAVQAGKDLGINVEVVVPTQYDPEQGVALFESLVAKGADDIAAIPQGEIWGKTVDVAIDNGMHVMVANVTAPYSKAYAFFGEGSYGNGQLLAKGTAEVLKAKGITSGKVMLGLCAPGIGVLIDRYNGFVDGLKAAMPDATFEYSDMLDVTAETGTNYTAWENIYTANPDMAVAVGLCSLDIPNLANLKEKTSAEFLVVGEDLDEATLDAIKKGLAEVTVGQHPYLQGYLPILALYQGHTGGEFVKGWVDVTNEVVSAANVDDYVARETDPAVEAAWYKDFIAKNFAEFKPLPIECASGIPGANCK